MNDPTEQKGKPTKNHFAFLDTPDGIKGGAFMLLLCSAAFIAHDLMFDTPPKEQWVPRTFAHGAFEISVPASWEFQHVHDDRPGRFWTKISSDSQPNLSMGVSAEAKVGSDATTLPHFRDQRTSAYVSQFEMTDAHITHVNVDSNRNTEVLDTFITATMNEKEVALRFRHFNFEDHWVEVMAMIVEGKPRRHQDTIEQVISSVRPTR